MKTKNAGQEMKKLFRIYHYFLNKSFKHNKRYFTATGMNMLFESLLPFVEVVFLPLIIDELMFGKDIKIVITLLFGMLLGNLIIGFMAQKTEYEMEKHALSLDNHFIELMSAKTMEMDFSFTEDKNALDQLEKAKEALNFASAGWTIKGLSWIVTSVFRLVGSLVIVAITAPWVLLISFVGMVATTYINGKNNANEVKFYKERASIKRAFNYSCGEIANIRYGKDIRLYNAFDLMMGNTGNYIRQISKYWRDQADRRTKLVIADCAIGATCNCMNFFYLGAIAILGNITIGVFTQVLTLSNIIGGAMTGITYGVQNILKLSNYAVEYVKFMEYPSVHRNEGKSTITSSHEIEFRNVSFQYPNTTIPILQNVSLKIKKGEHLAVVGLNGAGKTTFIKLLCRLYDVTEGEILLDGVNIKNYDYQEYIQLFAPVFQDFKLFAFSAKENITIQDEPIEQEHFNEVLELCDIKKKLDTLIQGIDTPIFRVYEEEGIELSGGEQQKMAIARAVYRNAPIMILDEPTAALDPVAEYEVYQKFHQIVGGKTAIYISHRLSACRFCDRIIVFSNGEIIENGSHVELNQLENGLYHTMWEAQAKYYN